MFKLQLINLMMSFLAAAVCQIVSCYSVYRKQNH